MPNRLIVGITGASGAVYGIRALEILRQDPGIETHLVLSQAARVTVLQETGWTVRQVEALADVVYSPANIGAPIASGSFFTSGMLIAPCSIKTLSAVAHCYTNDLLSRAADVQLKEGRPVVLLVRETPLHAGHLRLMSQAVENGAVIMPPVPAFYTRPKSVDDIVNATVGRALARLGLPNKIFDEWPGLANPRSDAPDGPEQG